MPSEEEFCNAVAKQELSYDAWGRLRNPATQVAYTPGSEPALFIGRGYTGHEHLPWFGLVNMNARLYDAALGRFLSPDPYVQAPNFTQNFNRYAYCFNNPLIYTDPSGEWALIDDLIGAFVGGVINWVSNGCQFSWKGLSHFGVGAVGGWASLYLSPAGGGALMSGMNSVVNQGFGADGKWNWNNIKLDGIVFDAAIGGATAGIGSKISGKLSPYISKYTSKLGGKAVQEMATQGLTSSATGFTLSTGASLLEGDDIETALGKGWGGAKSGWIAGSISGMGYGLRQAYKAGENPWTGKDLNVDKGNVQFGNNSNQEYHTFRHTDELGINRTQVRNAVEANLQLNSNHIQTGVPYNQAVVVNNQSIQYTAYKLPNGTINVGRIHGITIK